MNLVERTDLRDIHYLNSLKFKEFKAYVKSKDKSDKDLQVLFDKLKKFCEEHIKGKGEFKRTYHHTLSTPLEAGGRLFCGGSIQGFPKAIRGFLFGKTTTDIDFQNCHPKVLLWICKKHKIDCEELEKYCENRDDILACFPDREIAKNAYLSALNDEKPCYKLNKYPAELTKPFKAYDKEVKLIQKKILEIEEYKPCVETVPSNRAYNFNGSAINRVMCYEENKMLQIVLDKLAEKETELCALMFDGCMPYGNFYGDEALLAELMDAVNNSERYRDILNIVITYKEHSTEIVVPESFVSPAERENKLKGLTIVSNELEACEVIVERLKNRVVNCGSVLWYRGDDCVWRCEVKFVNSSIADFIVNSGILKLDKDDEPCDFVQNYKVSNNVKTLVVNKFLTMTSNEDWLKTKKSTSFNKLLFNNGYLNFNSREFVPLDKLDDEIYFFEKCPYDFEYSEPVEIEDVRKRFFTDPLGLECGKYFSTMLGRAIAGDVMKRFIFCVGEGNTGKSTLTQAVEMACGGYFGTFNAGCLAYKETSNDEAQQLRWLMLLQTKRIIISNEIKVNHKLDANAIKKMSSGGKDKIVARGHGGNESEYPFTALAIANMNDACEVAPKDDALNNRVKSFTYRKVYVPEVSNEETELLADPNVDAEVLTPEFRLKFINLLITDYCDFIENGEPDEPEEVVASKEKWFGISKDSIINSVLEDFEFTGNEEHYIRAKDLKQWIKERDLKITDTKLGMELGKYVRANGLNVVNKPKKLNGKTQTCWIGMKWITETEEIEEH
jgi:hypothetical protein